MMIWPLVITAVGVTTLNVGTFRYGFPEVRISLPANQPLYALEGRTNHIYFHNVVRFDGDWSLVTNTVTCAKGTSSATAWTYLPTAGDAGTNALTVTVKAVSSQEVLATATCSLVTRPLANPSSPVSRNLLIVGDSTSADGTVPAQLITLFTGDAQYSFSEVGSNDGTRADANGVNRSVSLEGVTGWFYQRFYTATTNTWTEINGTPRTGSPFVFSGMFDFATYLATNSITLSASDWVVFNLGINYIFQATTDADLATRAAAEIGAITNMIAAVRAVVPGIRIAVALTIPPTESDSLFYADYAGNPTLARYQRTNHLWVESLLAQFDVSSPSIYLLPLNANLDCANNMANGVHPSTAGYSQIADTYRAFLKGAE